MPDIITQEVAAGIQVTCDTGSAAGFANRYGEIEEPRCHYRGAKLAVDSP